MDYQTHEVRGIDVLVIGGGIAATFASIKAKEVQSVKLKSLSAWRRKMRSASVSIAGVTRRTIIPEVLRDRRNWAARL